MTTKTCTVCGKEKPASDYRLHSDKKTVMRQRFEEWHGFEVCDDMDIQTEVAWDNWKRAWTAAMEHAEATANKQAQNYAYTPAQKRALKTWLQIAARSDADSLACAAGFAANAKPYNALGNRLPATGAAKQGEEC